MEAIATFAYEVDQSPDTEEADTIQVYVTFVKPIDMDFRLRNSRSTFLARVHEFIEVPECAVKDRLHYFLREAGLDDNDNVMLVMKLIELAKLVTNSSDEYSPKHALLIWLTFKIVYPTSSGYVEHLEIEEASHILLDEMEIDFTPANKSAIDSLKRENYLESDDSNDGIVEECTICLANFKVGKTIVCLPCGHKFDEDCIVKWLATSRFCPLCRFELPCEDQRVYISTS